MGGGAWLEGEGGAPALAEVRAGSVTIGLKAWAKSEPGRTGLFLEPDSVET